MLSSFFLGASLTWFARIALSGICSIKPAPNTGVGIRKITLRRASSRSKSGCASAHPGASARPAIVNRSWTPPSGVPSAFFTNLASRTGPFGVMNDGTVLLAPSALANATWGFTGGLDPPSAGCRWQPPQLPRFIVGPRPSPASSSSANSSVPRWARPRPRLRRAPRDPGPLKANRPGTESHPGKGSNRRPQGPRAGRWLFSWILLLRQKWTPLLRIFRRTEPACQRIINDNVIDAQPLHRVADQRASAARPPLPRALGAGGQHHYRARRGGPPRARQHADPAARRALDPARHRAHAGIVHLRDQRPPLLVRRVLRQGILGRGILVGVLRGDRLRADLLGRERPRVRPAAHRRGAARRIPLGSGRLRPQRGAKYAICPLCAFNSSFRSRGLGIIQRLFREERIWIRVPAIPRALLRSTIPRSRWISSSPLASRRRSRRARPSSPRTAKAFRCCSCPTGYTYCWRGKSRFSPRASASPRSGAARSSARWPRSARGRAAPPRWRRATAAWSAWTTGSFAPRSAGIRGSRSC